MEQLAPFADQLNIFMNAKLNHYIQALSYSYAISLVLSIVFNSTLSCIVKKLKPISYVLYIANFLVTIARSVMCQRVFRTFNQFYVLFTLVMSIVCIVFTGI